VFTARYETCLSMIRVEFRLQIVKGLKERVKKINSTYPMTSPRSERDPCGI
jgi:hypothetical protein